MIADPCALIADVLDLAVVAGGRIMAVYNGDFEVEHKEDKSPLTEADMAAHDVIVNGLRRLTPDIPILSEEQADIPFAERRQWQTYWLVDPLDGTREFIKRNGEFTVNIALIRDHGPVLGVIYVPVTGISYYACQGQGAFRQDPASRPQRIQVKSRGQGPVKVAGSRSHRSPKLDTFLAQIGDYELLSMGSSLKSCLVAEGKADIYVRLGSTSEWDTAAAQCIVEQAGGQVTDTQEQPLRYNTKDSLINPSFLVFGDASQHWSRYLAGD